MSASLNKPEEKSQDESPKSKDVILQEEVAKILQSKGASLPPQKIREIAVSIATRFSGPIPPPDVLEAYERILPGSAHRIMTAFENQSAHRMGIEKHAVHEQLRQSGLGQILGTGIVLISLSITAWMGYIGQSWLAGTIGTTTVISLATIFYLGKRSQTNSLKGKNPKNKKDS